MSGRVEHLADGVAIHLGDMPRNLAVPRACGYGCDRPAIRGSNSEGDGTHRRQRWPRDVYKDIGYDAKAA